MDGKLVEKLDRQRYWAVLLETVGLFSGFAGTLWAYIEHGASPEVFMLTFGFGNLLAEFFGPAALFFTPDLLMLIVGGIWYGVIYLRARRNPQVMKALYNEMYQENKRRYQRLTLWVVIGGSILSAVVVTPRYPHVIVSEMTVLGGLLTMKISWLILNRK